MRGSYCFKVWSEKRLFMTHRQCVNNNYTREWFMGWEAEW